MHVNCIVIQWLTFRWMCTAPSFLRAFANQGGKKSVMGLLVTFPDTLRALVIDSNYVLRFLSSTKKKKWLTFCGAKNGCVGFKWAIRADFWFTAR